jgi:hypothetical protein
MDRSVVDAGENFAGVMRQSSKKREVASPPTNFDKKYRFKHNVMLESPHPLPPPQGGSKNFLGDRRAETAHQSPHTPGEKTREENWGVLIKCEVQKCPNSP